MTQNGFGFGPTAVENARYDANLKKPDSINNITILLLNLENTFFEVFFDSKFSSLLADSLFTNKKVNLKVMTFH